MQFSTRKMMIAVILVAVLLALFLGFALRSIQQVNTSVEIQTDTAIDSSLAAVAETILSKWNVAYVDAVSLEDIGMDILLVDHLREAACIIKERLYYAVNYNTLDPTVVSCNQYLMLVDKRQTLVINCDEMLGDAAVRAITCAYGYTYASTEALNPDSVDYFPSAEQDETISFTRYQMIQSAISSYFEDAALDAMYYFYEQWADAEGAMTYQEVIRYDYYDGFYAYVTAKVRMDLDSGFDLREYIDSYQNEFDLYAKDRESAVAGLLWCLLAEKQGLDVIVDTADTKDIYRTLFGALPLGQVEEAALRDVYQEKFSAYRTWINDTIAQYQGDAESKDAVVLDLTAERYEETIKIDTQHYIYLRYTARTRDNELLILDGVLASVTPYRITLYLDTSN